MVFIHGVFGRQKFKKDFFHRASALYGKGRHDFQDLAEQTKKNVKSTRVNGGVLGEG